MNDISLPYEKTRALYEVEKTFEWRKWMHEIPYLQFPAHWLVKAIPPFSVGVIRYRVTTEPLRETDCVSVYLDCYDQVGCMGQPYWEIYPIDGDCERYLMNETTELLAGIGKALAELEAKHTVKSCSEGKK